MVADPHAAFADRRRRIEDTSDAVVHWSVTFVVGVVYWCFEERLLSVLPEDQGANAPRSP